METTLKGIYTLFDTAIASRLKYPSISLQTSKGSPIEIKRAGNKSRYQGQLMITDGRPFGSNAYYGRIDQTGVFYSGRETCTELLPLLQRLADNPAEVAGEYGRLTGRCSFCSLALTDPESTAVGYGPICASHYGLPHGRR
jgi:uncharacterized protein DUF6011